MTAGFGYDEELPAGFQEADLEQAEFERQAAEYAALRRGGWCVHGWSGPGPTPGTRQCREDGCGLIWSEKDYPQVWDVPEPTRIRTDEERVADEDAAADARDDEAAR
jgi:hypothetical protein